MMPPHLIETRLLLKTLALVFHLDVNETYNSRRFIRSALLDLQCQMAQLLASEATLTLIGSMESQQNLVIKIACIMVAESQSFYGEMSN